MQTWLLSRLAAHRHALRIVERCRLSGANRVLSRHRQMTECDPDRPLSANLFCTAKIYSFDQFVRAQQESLGDGEADGLCGLDVNHQLELGRGIAPAAVELGKEALPTLSR